MTFPIRKNSFHASAGLKFGAAAEGEQGCQTLAGSNFRSFLRLLLGTESTKDWTIETVVLQAQRAIALVLMLYIQNPVFLAGSGRSFCGNLFTTETYEGKRVQKFTYKGMGTVTATDQGPPWPK